MLKERCISQMAHAGMQNFCMELTAWESFELASLQISFFYELFKLHFSYPTLV